MTEEPTIVTATKPLIVGESNPYGSDPYYALYPAPDGCSGHRLCCLILRMGRRQYLDTFERANLCDGPWSKITAVMRARKLLEFAGGAKLILLGSKVCGAFGVPYRPFEVHAGHLVLPHPSGLCRLWNEPGALRRAREAVAAFLPEVAHLLGEDDRGDS